MSRPREFDIDEALDRAMDVFWAKGYEGASLGDLLDAMSIARGSLYKAFKDKHAIYLAALDRYDRTEVERAVAGLRDGSAGDGAARVHRFLDGARSAVLERGDRRGCFLCNAAVDRAPTDAEARGRVLAMVRRHEEAVATALKESRVARGWRASRRAAAAVALVNAYMGLRVLAKAGYSPEELASIIATTLRGAGLEPARRR